MNHQLPRVFQAYSGTKSTSVGKNGIIRIELAADNSSKTFIKDLQTKAPLLVQKALYPNAELPNTAHIYLMSSAGGILQGDKLKIDIIAGKNTLSHITTQAATKIYKVEKGYASQYINLYAQNGAYLEFIPHQIIPYKSSKFYQEVNLIVETTATVIYSEIISAGRLASGEKFDFDICFLRLTAYDVNGKILFSDVMNMQPTKNKNEFAYLFGDKTICSTVYIVTKSIENEKIDHEISSSIKNRSILASCSALPNDSGIVVRILSDSIDEINDLISTITTIIRNNSTCLQAVH